MKKRIQTPKAALLEAATLRVRPTERMQAAMEPGVEALETRPVGHPAELPETEEQQGPELLAAADAEMEVELAELPAPQGPAIPASPPQRARP